MDLPQIERVFPAGGMIPSEMEIMEPEDEYDAFNEDTFGNDAEAWTEDDHDQLVGAHISEVTEIGSFYFKNCRVYEF